MIDKGMQEIIRILNDKGYKTRFCCEGHGPYDAAYIMFDKRYPFGDNIPMPKGFKGYGKRGNTYFSVQYVYGKSGKKYPEVTQEMYEKMKEEALNNLLEWSKELPDCK